MDNKELITEYESQVSQVYNVNVYGEGHWDAVHGDSPHYDLDNDK